MSIDNKTENAVLVGIQLPRVSNEELECSLQELKRLVTTLGFNVVGQVIQKRSSTRTASVLGQGKLQELAKWTGGTGDFAPIIGNKPRTKDALEESDSDSQGEEAEDSISEDLNDPDSSEEFMDQDDSSFDVKNLESAQVVVVDTDLSPSQLRNLERATGVDVLDRTGVIIQIFRRHARTRAARLQVEIARLTYVAPRLRETGGDEDQQGGGGKGAGESSIELDKRKIRDRIKELKDELASIGNEHQVRRARREQEISVALVGYTNAGKSSLMRALTGSDVLVADKLFATLDTTIRPLYPETRPKVLLSDTVGFIKKLPHDLVASFKSTLDEALYASLLLFVVDASDPSFRSQLEVTEKVLGEVGAEDVPRILILNKRDCLNEEQAEALTVEFPEALLISTRDKQDLTRLRDKIMSYFESQMVDEDIFIPYMTQGIVGEVRAKMRVLKETYDAHGVTLTVRSSPDKIQSIRNKVPGSF